MKVQGMNNLDYDIYEDSCVKLLLIAEDPPSLNLSMKLLNSESNVIIGH